MKKILLILLFIPLVSLGQSWIYSEGVDVFDGKYKTSSKKGNGNNFPYNNPALVINKFENKQLNFYISDGGYFQENTNIRILWIFDNEPENIYSSYDWSISGDGKTLFFKDFNNSKENDGTKLKPVEMIEKLVLANKVNVRISDRFGKNDIVFSLSGSTEAINFVISKEEREGMIKKVLSDREAKSKSESQNKIVLQTLMKKAKNEKLRSINLSILEYKIMNDLGMGYLPTMATGKKYKSLYVEGKIGDPKFEKNGYVSLFYILDNDTKEEISGTWRVEENAPIFKKMKEIKLKNEELQKVKEAKENILFNKILSKYSRDDLIAHLKKAILKKRDTNIIYQDLDSFSISEIKKVQITLSEYRSNYKRYEQCKLEIFLNNGNIETIDKTLGFYKIDITRRELKQLGGKEDIPF
jgi:hypothetical protein